VTVQAAEACLDKAPEYIIEYVVEGTWGDKRFLRRERPLRGIGSDVLLPLRGKLGFMVV
jgi:hypothetical protein